jgi:hypothetical protein
MRDQTNPGQQEDVGVALVPRTASSFGVWLELYVCVSFLCDKHHGLLMDHGPSMQCPDRCTRCRLGWLGRHARWWMALGGDLRDDDGCGNLREDVSELEAHTRLQGSNWELSERQPGDDYDDGMEYDADALGGRGNLPQAGVICPNLPRLPFVCVIAL